MAVKNIKARLEGSYRLIRIRKIKNIFLAIQLIIAIVIGLLTSYLLGMNTDPLYFPTDYFTFIFLILVLIISVEAVYFKGLEIKYTRNKSRKFLLARNAIRRSAAIISICGLLVIMLFIPFTHETILDTYTVGGTDITARVGDPTSQVFDAQDKLGLVRVSSIEVTFPPNESCEMYISENDISVRVYDPPISDHYTWNGLIERSDTQTVFMLIVTNSQPYDITFDSI